MPDAGRQLLTLLQQHVEGHLKAHGNGRVRPKTHWGFDIAECMVQDELLVDSLITEHLHLRSKDVAENCHNLKNYESSVMSGVLNAHARMLTDNGASPARFIGPTTSPPGAPNVRIADKLQHFGEHL